jgi:O-antigen ligase
MNEDRYSELSRRMDKFCAIVGGAVPIGLAIGNIAFESIVATVGMVWIAKLFFLKINPFKDLIKHPLVYPWLIWFAFIMVSLLFNGSGFKGWVHDLAFARYVIYGCALLDISRRQNVSGYLLKGLGAAVLLAAISTSMAYLTGFDFLGRPLILYTGKLKQAEMISGISAYAAPLFLGWGIFGKDVSRFKRGFILFLGTIAFIQVNQTQIRSAILACVAGIFFVSCFGLIKKISHVVIVLVLMALIVFSGIYYMKSGEWNFKEIYKHEKSSRWSDVASIYDRLYIWEISWKIWEDHKLFGTGVSKYQDAYKETAAKGFFNAVEAPDGQEFKGEEACHAHNLVLMLLACTGLTGLFVFAWFFTNAVRLIIKNHSGWRIGLTSWPVVVLVAGLVGYNIYHSWYQALFSYFIVMIGADRKNRKVEDG